MTGDWQEAERIFKEALDKDPSQRDAFLRNRCGQDPDLLREVQDLLASYGKAREGFLEIPVYEGMPIDVEDPTAIGPYRLIRTLGTGGMGTVWLAEQETPIRRAVAIKLIRPGLNTEQVIARFENERQALAIMTHPNIAHVHDAGATPDGRPYFVMEYVPGDPITTYCRQESIGLHARLSLFLDVCHAVQHAHQRGVIHRDLKPGNVLVTERDGVPFPVIIDFGVAKATTFDSEIRPFQTQMGQVIGTLEYMSPEQTRGGGHDVDTRSDVYSLGVLLYELLTDALPFDFSDIRGDFTGILNRIQKDEPRRPSENVRGMLDPRRLRGDLDWIVTRALEKNPDQRYASASELAADIERYLRDETVLAGPPRTMDRVRKFARRHRASVVTGSVLFLAAIALAVTMTVQAGRIARERDRANQEADTAERITDFLVDVFQISDPDEARGSTVTAREVLETAAGRMDAELADEPEMYVRMLGTIGTVHFSLGLFNDAKPLLQRSVGLTEELYGPRDPRSLAAKDALASLYREQGHFAAAESLQRGAWEGFRDVMGPGADETLRAGNHLALILARQAKWEEAEALYLDVLDTQRGSLGEDDPETLSTLNNLATMYVDRSAPEQAIPYLEDVLERRLRILGDDHTDTMTSMNNLAVALMEIQEPQRADSLLVRALASQNRVLGPEHLETLRTMGNLSRAHQMQEHYDEAQDLIDTVLVIQERVLGLEHPETLVSMGQSALLSVTRGQLDIASEKYRKILVTRRKTLGLEHPETLRALNNLAVIRRRAGDLAEAESLLTELIEIRTRILGEDHRDTLRAVSSLGLVWEKQGRLDECEEVLTRVHGRRAQTLGPGHRDTVRSAQDLARVRMSRSDWEGAVAVLRSAMEAGASPEILDDPRLARLRSRPEFAPLSGFLTAAGDSIKPR